MIRSFEHALCQEGLVIAKYNVVDRDLEFDREVKHFVEPHTPAFSRPSHYTTDRRHPNSTWRQQTVQKATRGSNPAGAVTDAIWGAAAAVVLYAVHKQSLLSIAIDRGQISVIPEVHFRVVFVVVQEVAPLATVAAVAAFPHPTSRLKTRMTLRELTLRGLYRRRRWSRLQFAKKNQFIHHS